MKKVCGLVVVYNPSDDVYSNLDSYKSLVDKLYVLDNSDFKNYTFILNIQNDGKIVYVDLKSNQGIAKAQKIGMSLAINDGFDYCLTMDQDSIFPSDDFPKIVAYLNDEKFDDYGIIGLNYDRRNRYTGLKAVHDIISSGNFINISNYKLIDGFREELFIDWVDFDICEQFNSVNKKIGMIGDIFIEHKIGNPIKIKFFGKTFFAMNHSPIRYFYRYRNSLYLFKKNKSFYKKYYYKSIFFDIAKVVFFEDDKILKLKMIFRGRKAARKGILGKYVENKNDI